MKHFVIADSEKKTDYYITDEGTMNTLTDMHYTGYNHIWLTARPLFLATEESLSILIAKADVVFDPSYNARAVAHATAAKDEFNSALDNDAHVAAFTINGRNIQHVFSSKAGADTAVESVKAAVKPFIPKGKMPLRTNVSRFENQMLFQLKTMNWPYMSGETNAKIVSDIKATLQIMFPSAVAQQQQTKTKSAIESEEPDDCSTMENEKEKERQRDEIIKIYIFYLIYFIFFLLLPFIYFIFILFLFYYLVINRKKISFINYLQKDNFSIRRFVAHIHQQVIFKNGYFWDLLGCRQQVTLKNGYTKFLKKTGKNPVFLSDARRE